MAVEVQYHLVSWNIKNDVGKGMAQKRKNVVSKYLTTEPLADILFLQEVQWVPYKRKKPCKFDSYKPNSKPKKLYKPKNPKQKPPNLRYHLNTLSDHHELSYYSKENSTCYNCVIFDKRRFEVLPTMETEVTLTKCFKLLDWEKTEFKRSQEKLMRNRMCVVVLKDKSNDFKFIAASLHNIKNKNSIKMAELFLQLLALVGETTGYPVVLAGDFNANIQKSSEVARLGFTIPEYKPTLHRMNRKSPIDVTIDFFLYRPGKDRRGVLHNVRAELADNNVVDSREVISKKKMDELDKVSNHDPLRASLQLFRAIN